MVRHEYMVGAAYFIVHSGSSPKVAVLAESKGINRLTPFEILYVPAARIPLCESTICLLESASAAAFALFKSV